MLVEMKRVKQGKVTASELGPSSMGWVHVKSELHSLGLDSCGASKKCEKKLPYIYMTKLY